MNQAQIMFKNKIGPFQQSEYSYHQNNLCAAKGSSEVL